MLLLIVISICVSLMFALSRQNGTFGAFAETVTSAMEMKKPDMLKALDKLAEIGTEETVSHPRRRTR